MQTADFLLIGKVGEVGMSYQSPVDLILSEMNLRMEGEIFKAVQNVGVNVDRDELLKALRYDRDQYQKGYADRDAEIVRCEDCEYSYTEGFVHPHLICEKHPEFEEVADDWFCADGKRKE